MQELGRGDGDWICRLFSAVLKTVTVRKCTLHGSGLNGAAMYGVGERSVLCRSRQNTRDGAGRGEAGPSASSEANGLLVVLHATSKCNYISPSSPQLQLNYIPPGGCVRVGSSTRSIVERLPACLPQMALPFSSLLFSSLLFSSLLFSCLLLRITVLFQAWSEIVNPRSLCGLDSTRLDGVSTRTARVCLGCHGGEGGS